MNQPPIQSVPRSRRRTRQPHLPGTSGQRGGKATVDNPTPNLLPSGRWRWDADDAAWQAERQQHEPDHSTEPFNAAENR